LRHCARRQKINDNGGRKLENITAAKKNSGALIEAQKKRVAAMRAQGDFVDYAALPQIVIAYAAATASARPLRMRPSACCASF
jgi:hypothetical protein